MDLREEINNSYFEWMYSIVSKDRFGDGISFRKLLMRLHNIEFVCTIRKDEKRIDDGIELRYRYPHEYFGVEDIGRYIDGPCSVLEMMMALAIRCEETIMDNPSYGDRTAQWFWDMIVSLGLGSMQDNLYDEEYIDFVIQRFLNRKYEPNGKGGLFTIRDCQDDLRKVEIWNQMCWFLGSIDPSVGLTP